MIKSRVFLALIPVLLSAAFLTGCKKNPITPDAEELSRPVIWLNTFELSFAACETGPNPSSQTLKIKNSGQGTLEYSISDDADWLTIEPATGTSSGQTNEHAIAVNKEGLAAQESDYTATITVTSSQAYNNPQRVSVSLEISKEPPPEIAVTPQALTFACQIGSGNPAAQTITIRNSGQSTLNYTITDDAAWLEVAPAGGTSAGESKVHTVSANAGGLSEGTYTALITIADPNATNSPQRVSVSLEISKEPPPEIAVTPPALTFACQIGSGNPAAQTITIWNSGQSTLNYAITDDAAWLEVAPAGGTSMGETRIHTVLVSTGGLSDGTYTTLITVADPNATNSPQRVGVTLQVTPIPTNNEISVACLPSQGGTGATISVPISVLGNLSEISTFGLQLTFDTNMFEYIGTDKGNLTGSWAFVDGNNISGTVTIGGFAGSGSPIPQGSAGSLTVVTLRVTGGSYGDGQQSQITIRGYTDDIAGMKPEPATATFTLRK